MRKQYRRARVVVEVHDEDTRLRRYILHREDVKRVLKKLVELNLVKRGERPIYYKRDALTYLEIMSKNKYGLKATSCSSADVLAGKFELDIGMYINDVYRYM